MGATTARTHKSETDEPVATSTKQGLSFDTPPTVLDIPIDFVMGSACLVTCFKYTSSYKDYLEEQLEYGGGIVLPHNKGAEELIHHHKYRGFGGGLGYDSWVRQLGPTGPRHRF